MSKSSGSNESVNSVGARFRFRAARTDPAIAGVEVSCEVSMRSIRAAQSL